MLGVERAPGCGRDARGDQGRALAGWSSPRRDRFGSGGSFTARSVPLSDAHICARSRTADPGRAATPCAALWRRTSYRSATCRRRLVPETARARFAFVCRRDGVVAGSRCAIEALALTDPPDHRRLAEARRESRVRRRRARRGRRTSRADPHRGTDGAQFPLSPLGNCDPHPRLRRRGRSQPTRRPAFSTRGRRHPDCALSRRRPCARVVAPITAGISQRPCMIKDNHLAGIAHRRRGRNGAPDVAGPDGGGRVRESHSR